MAQQQMNRDPDANAIAIFKNHAIKNAGKTATAGRPIFDDMEVCEIRFAGSRSVSVFPATAISHWIEDPTTGEQRSITYAERFSRQYQQFKMHAAQTASGTPIDYAPFLTEARRAELRALNIYTIEQLGHIDGQELKNLGHGGREMKNQAQAYLAETAKGAPNAAMMAELEQLRAQNAILQEDLERKNANAEKGSEFDGMTLEQLRNYITSQTGHAPHGSLNRKTLLRMAAEAQSKAA